MAPKNEPPFGDKVISWYGNIAAQNLSTHPTFVKHWLMTGYKAMTAKSAMAPNTKQLPSGKEGYALFMKRVVDAMDDAEKSVITSIFVPNEVFHAMGLKPVTAEAVASFVSGAQAEHAFIGAAEDTGIPETYCSYHKALMGMALSNILEPRHMVACTSVACDANNLTFRALAKRWDAAQAYLDIPIQVDRDSICYVADQLREMTQIAEDAYHVKLNEIKLHELVACSLTTTTMLEHTLAYRGEHYLANSMTLDLMEMLNAHLLLGTTEAEHMVSSMLRDVKSSAPFTGTKLVWAHVAPYFLGSIGSWIDYNPQAQIVASDMMFDHLTPKEGLIFDASTPYEAMAERVVRNCFNGPASRRIDTIRRIAQATKADGVVVFCHWGCKQTAGSAQLIRHALEDEGYPVLVLDGDAVDRRNCMEGQMATRFDAFMELITKRKEAVNGATR